MSDAPHSRACGIARHDHGLDCSANCPTCHGRPLDDTRPVAPARLVFESLDVMAHELDLDAVQAGRDAVTATPRIGSTADLLRRVSTYATSLADQLDTTRTDD